MKTHTVIAEVEGFRLSATTRSTDIETYMFLLAREQKLLHTTHQAVIMAMAQEIYDDQLKFGALSPDITTPLNASIEDATHLLQDVVSTAQRHHELVTTHHRDFLDHAITSLTLQPSVALHRCD
jgi:hypothetical protein